MSLILSFPTHHGIVMTADNRIITSVYGEESTQTFLKTDNEQKIFLLKNGFGLSYCGSSVKKNVPISAIIESLNEKLDYSRYTPESLLTYIATYINNLDSSQSTTFIMSGYKFDKCFVLSIETSQLQIRKLGTGTVAFAGECDMLYSLLNDPKYKYDYEKFNLQDAIDFLTLLNRTVANFQHFQQQPQTVSEDCDVLVIKKTSSYYISNKELLMRFEHQNKC